jgi:hypothetical protein
VWPKRKARLDKGKELNVSLSGNLGFVSLDEILRLLTRAKQSGSVDVRGDEVRGRVFVTRGGVALATTADDAIIRQHLIRSGFADESYLDSVEAGDATLAPLAEKSGGALVELLREMTVESVYQLGLNGSSFEVAEGRETPFGSPEPFALEHLLDDSKQRLTDWTEVSKTVADLDARLNISRDLGDRTEVKIDSDSWRVISEIGSGSTVTTVAAELGTTNFWTARIVAHLVEDSLVEVEDIGGTAEIVTEPVPWDRASGVSDHEVAENLDPNQSWWEEPKGDENDDTEPASTDDFAAGFEESDSDGEGVPEVEYEDPYDEEGIPAIDMPSAPANEDADADVEEDTEAFLEKVFSELGSTSDDQNEDEGYGLLRRRRMGAIRDVSGDV